MSDINQIINLEKYPINDVGSLKYKELTNYTKKQLHEDGCCVLPNFIKPDSVRRMKDEVDKNLSKIILQVINIIHTLQKTIKHFLKIIQKEYLQLDKVVI